MMLWHTLKLPWITSTRFSRWLAAFTVMLGAVLTALAAIALHDHDRRVLCGVLWSSAIASWWLLVVCNALWLGRDATALRLPGVRRAANRSVLLHAVLTVVLPALAFGYVMGHGLFWLVTFTSVVAGLMLFLLLPSWLMLALCLAPLLLPLFVHAPLSLHGLSWGFAALLAMITLDAWCWFRLLNMQTPAMTSLGRPAIWNLRYQATHGFLGTRNCNGDGMLASSSRTWLAPIIDLRDVGPNDPVRGIRVALGRAVMPQTWFSILRQGAFGLGMGVLPSLLIALCNRDARVVDAFLFLPNRGWFMLPMLVGLIALMTSFMAAMSIRARWSGASAELALLALLPGLGAPDAAKRHALRACLGQPLLILVAAFAILAALGFVAHALPAVLVYAFLCLSGCAVFVTSIVLGTLGGRPLSRITMTAMTIVLLSLTSVTLSLAPGHAALHADLLGSVLIVWSLACGVCALLILRGWRALLHRPHSFLANAS
jgi:hypothetical protein